MLDDSSKNDHLRVLLVLVLVQHFNIYLSSAFVVVAAHELFSRLLKQQFVVTDDDFFAIFSFFLFIVLEVARTLIGQKGKSTSTCCTLSIIPQLPLCIFFAYFQDKVSIGENIFASLLAPILFIEIILSRRIKTETPSDDEYNHDLEQELRRLERENELTEVAYWTQELDRWEKEG